MSLTLTASPSPSAFSPSTSWSPILTRHVSVPVEGTEFQRRFIARLRERGWIAAKSLGAWVLSKEFDTELEGVAEEYKCLIESVRP